MRVLVVFVVSLKTYTALLFIKDAWSIVGATKVQSCLQEKAIFPVNMPPVKEDEDLTDLFAIYTQFQSYGSALSDVPLREYLVFDKELTFYHSGPDQGAIEEADSDDIEEDVVGDCGNGMDAIVHS
ncbi:unnamed protein product [Soboliphyme baturini]|uniref:RNA-directed DNA methylation 4 n=1 Tax=Soboliphyme baturini TaxID=241478 RepID=A0A183I9L0_9BILA|nr:unnamed protein product [Soboliphyme baturini]